MNRKHTSEQYLDIVKKIRSLRPDFEISTDIIVGFTDESDAAFENTLKIVQEIDVSLIYISEYSLRAGTTAAKRMPDNIPPEIKHKRFHILNDWLRNQVQKKMKSFVGSTQKVLIENKNKHGLLEGKTEHNFTCQVLGENINIGDIVSVQITESSTWSLTGKYLPF